jgi:Uncharacterised protein family (UPF0175)
MMFSPDERPPFILDSPMLFTLDLPDELAAALTAQGPDLPRAALEFIALEAYRERKLSTAQLRGVLGFESTHELDGFLKQHEVWLEYGRQDLERYHRIMSVATKYSAQLTGPAPTQKEMDDFLYDENGLPH